MTIYKATKIVKKLPDLKLLTTLAHPFYALLPYRLDTITTVSFDLWLNGLPDLTQEFKATWRRLSGP
jgi:hypothetical protein